MDNLWLLKSKSLVYLCSAFSSVYAKARAQVKGLAGAKACARACCGSVRGVRKELEKVYLTSVADVRQEIVVIVSRPVPWSYSSPSSVRKLAHARARFTSG